MDKRIIGRVTSAAIAVLIACGPVVGQQKVSLSFSDSDWNDNLATLGRAIGDRRIVLLGENGHGVGEFSQLKVRLIQWLHEEKGFDVIAMESGFWECETAGENSSTPRTMLHSCLSHAFQHAELMPLFEQLFRSRASGHRMALSGMDIQAQGYDSRGRPEWTLQVLGDIDSGLAARVARQDSLIYLPSDLGGLGDSVYPWLADSGTVVMARYDSAAALTDGMVHWSYRMSHGLIERLQLRADAEMANQSLPDRYYEVRDEWMARAVAALADSIVGGRKVVVWLHNDHARYGNWSSGARLVRAAGSHLRDWFPDDLYSVGLFMGGGKIADNGRNVRDVLPAAPGSIEGFLAGEGDARYLVLTGNDDPAVGAFADSSRAYNRMGTATLHMTPADEFDVLFIVDSVNPPQYQIP